MKLKWRVKYNDDGYNRERWEACIPMTITPQRKQKICVVFKDGFSDWHGQIAIWNGVVWHGIYTHAYDARRGCEQALRQLVKDLQEVTE